MQKNIDAFMCLVEFEPVGRRITVSAGVSVMAAAQRAGVDLVAACGGVGICGTCLVRLVQGTLSPVEMTESEFLSSEQIAQGYRLACQARVVNDVRIDIPPESLPVAQRMQIDGQEDAVAFQPAVVALDVEVNPPGQDDLRSDLTRLEPALDQAGFPPLTGDLSVLADISDWLRKQNWSARLAVRPSSYQTELVGAFKPGEALLGLAVDMGSTKLAGYLVDLQSGATLASGGAMNPQIAYGEDVVSRIAFANEGNDNRILLHSRLMDAINKIVTTLTAQVGAQPEQIVDAVLVGNTAMHHFACGLPVAQLGAAPYVPAVSQPLDVRAQELGLKIAHGARVYLPANIAGYVGGDHTAALLAATGRDHGATQMLVDIGTNTEISLVNGQKIFTCSTASGPAFEGAHIHDGMRAAPGAIESVRIRNGQVEALTVGGQAPVGICGTGILKAISEMFENGVIDSRGTLQKDHPRIRQLGKRAAFLLVEAAHTGHQRDIFITRGDVNEIQLAKGAIRAGIDILLQAAGLQAEQVNEWVIAGAFGTYLEIESALRLGMFPDIPANRFQQVGNAAGAGAKRMLLSCSERALASALPQRVQYIELTNDPHFTQMFVQSMYFPAIR